MLQCPSICLAVPSIDSGSSAQLVCYSLGCRPHPSCRPRAAVIQGTWVDTDFLIRTWCQLIVAVTGQSVLVYSGTVLRRWMPLVADSRANIDLVILANHVQVINEQRTTVLLTKELVSCSWVFVSYICQPICYSVVKLYICNLVWYFYASTHPTDGTRGIMLSVCAMYTLASLYLGRDISHWLAVEFLF